MAAGKHIGKVMLKIRDEESDKFAKPQPILVDALPRYRCRPDRSFIICGE